MFLGLCHFRPQSYQIQLRLHREWKASCNPCPRKGKLGTKLPSARNHHILPRYVRCIRPLPVTRRSKKDASSRRHGALTLANS